MIDKRIESLITMRGLSEVRAGMIVHKTDGKVLFASRDYQILRSTDGGINWQIDGWIPVPKWRRWMDSLPLFKRMSRGGVSYILPLSDGSRLCVLPKMIVRADIGSSKYDCVFRIARGSRPLNLCQGPEGKIYWGEYFLNLRRSKSVHVFCSKDRGRNWDVIYTFPKGSICHIHRIVYDPYDNAFLVSTGDRDGEVAIWKTDGDFSKLEPVVQGNQLYRTASILPLPSCILYGTDNPNGENYIMALSRGTGSTDKIQQLPGPVLYGCQVGDRAVFATMVEKQHHEVSLWSGDGNGFTMLAHLEARKWNRPWRELAGYPTAILPEGISEWPHLYFTPVGTQTYANSMIHLNLKALSGRDKPLKM